MQKVSKYIFIDFFKELKYYKTVKQMMFFRHVLLFFLKKEVNYEKDSIFREKQVRLQLQNQKG